MKNALHNLPFLSLRRLKTVTSVLLFSLLFANPAVDLPRPACFSEPSIERVHNHIQSDANQPTGMDSLKYGKIYEGRISAKSLSKRNPISKSLAAVQFAFDYSASYHALRGQSPHLAFNTAFDSHSNKAPPLSLRFS